MRDKTWFVNRNGGEAIERGRFLTTQSALSSGRSDANFAGTSVRNGSYSDAARLRLRELQPLGPRVPKNLYVPNQRS